MPLHDTKGIVNCSEKSIKEIKNQVGKLSPLEYKWPMNTARRSIQVQTTICIAVSTEVEEEVILLTKINSIAKLIPNT